MNPLKMIMRSLMRLPTCEEVNKFLVDYIDGTLPEKTRKKFEAHLKRCPNCAPFFQQYKSTIELVREDRDIRIPDYLVEHTLAFLRQNIGSA